MSSIHPSAIVEDGAAIGDGVEIGPFCHIGPEVVLGPGVRLHSHVVVAGRTRIGAGTEVYPFAVLGEPPQDLKYDGAPTEVQIGEHTLIREHVTVHRGVPHGGGVTRIGSHCFLMVGSHIAHDCQLGDHVVIINGGALAGHCEVGDYAIVSGLSALHQFVRIGRHAFIAGMTGIEHDVVPFGLAKGILRRAHLTGLNLIGLKRRGFGREEIQALRDAFRTIFEGPSESLRARAEEIAARYPGVAPVGEMVDFIRARPERKLCLPPGQNMNVDVEGL
jgi:UDP-N-acetylglucosamine acyltransferase